jgi:hypothetical protein
MEIIAVILEAIVAAITAIVEAILGFFMGGVEALSAWEAIGLVLIFIFELVFWLLLCIASLLVALVKWRRPEKVAWRVIWRPRKTQKKSKEDL